MIETTKLPENLVYSVNKTARNFKPTVEKRALENIEVQNLNVAAWTCIAEHGHEEPPKWEVWIHLAKKTAYVCLKGEKHELVNHSNREMILMAMKGEQDCSYKELEEIFSSWGFEVVHGSLRYYG